MEARLCAGWLLPVKPCRRTRVWKDAFLEPRQENMVELEALCAMQRCQRDGGALVVAIGIADQRSAVEKIMECLARLGAFRHGVYQLAQVFRTRSVFRRVSFLEHLKVSGLIQYQAQK